MLTTAEAADRLGLTARSVARLIKQERIAASKYGRDYLIDETEVVRYATERRPPGRPHRKERPMNNHRDTQPLTQLIMAVEMVADPRGSEIRYFQDEATYVFDMIKREEQSYTVPTNLEPDQLQRIHTFVEQAAIYLSEHSGSNHDRIIAAARAFVAREQHPTED